MNVDVNMIENTITQLIVGVSTVRCNRCQLKKGPITQEISDMLEIGRETLQDFPVDILLTLSPKSHCVMHHFDCPMKKIECCCKPPIAQWAHPFRSNIFVF